MLEPFGALLREKLAELDADETAHAVLEDDPVERLRLDARQAVLAEQVPMPRGGHQAYVTPLVEEPKKRHLNILR
ncbi:MAG: hypothetical protein ABMA00_12530 [Gemmatimonas sp.]